MSKCREPGLTLHEALHLMIPERRYDIDWLRVFATYLLFPFHVSKVFDVPPFYHIKNAELSGNLALFTTFVHQWHMPLFFLLAGWSLQASLSRRSTGAVLHERVLRIFVPFLFGCCTLCVGLGYVEKILMPGKDVSFLAFVPQFFTNLEYFTWGHLWFLIYLFTFTLLYMPLFMAIRRIRPGSDAISAGWLYLPLIPLVLMQLVLRIRWPGMQNLYDDWANFCFYSSFLILGFTTGRLPAVEEAISREWRRAGVIGLALSVVFLLSRNEDLRNGVAGYFLQGVNGPIISEYGWKEVVAHFAYYVLGTATGYCLLMGMLGFARAHLCFENKALKYLAESALPVYILHQGGIVFTGYPIIKLAWGIPAKMSLLLPVAIIATMGTYHFLVRPFSVPRFLFGMKSARLRPR